MQLLRVCLLAIGIAVECNGKVWKGLARLSARRPWVPLTSFAYDIGNGEVRWMLLLQTLLRLGDGKSKRSQHNDIVRLLKHKST